MLELNSPADLDSAFYSCHKQSTDRLELDLPNDGLLISADSEPAIGMDALESDKPVSKAAMPADLNSAQKASVEDEEVWQYEPVVGFKTFCESEEHMKLLPKNWKKGEEGALSYKQYKDCIAILGNDPKKIFDPKTRKYLIAVLLWAKGCIGEGTKIFDETTKKSYTIKEIVDKDLNRDQKISVKSFDEKNKKIVVKKVSDFFSKGKVPCVEITFRFCGKKIVGKDHLFYTLYGWRNAENLSTGSLVATNLGMGMSPVIDEEVLYVHNIGDKEVFDLTIDEETPNYFDADGILHHNSGKDFICSIVQAYLVYILLCLRNPQDFFGFAAGEACDILNVGKKGQQAERVYFKKFRARILKWKWMLDKYNVTDEGRRFHYRGKNYPMCKVGVRSAEWTDKNVRAFSENSGDPEALEGYNIIFYICDEISGWVSLKERETAVKILSVLRSSQVSRQTKNLCGLGMVISYPRQDDDIMFRLEEESKEEGSRIYFSRGLQQEIKPKRFYSGKTFKFNAGTKDLPELVDIPVELTEDFFKKNPEKAKGMFLLRPPAVGDQYFEYVDKIDAVAFSDRQPLFKVETDYIDSKDGEGGAVYYVRKRIVGLNRPPLPNVDYVGWVDAGEVTCDASLSIGHLEMVKIVEAGQTTDIEAVVCDHTFVWEPNEKMRRIVDIDSISDACIAMLNFIDLRAVFWDWWNSSTGVFRLRQKNILCDRHNLDGADFDHFKAILYTSRFIAPKCAATSKGVGQVKHLSRTSTGNVTPGSGLHKKDIADTWCGITTLLTGSLIKKSFRIGRAPRPINIGSEKTGVSGGSYRSASATGVPGSTNPFGGHMAKAGQQLVKDHSDLFSGLSPSVSGRTRTIGRTARTGKQQTKSRFPRGIRL